MAVPTYNVFSPHRDLCMKNILNACIEKKWSMAEDLAKDYTDYCKIYWPEAEKYPFCGQLVCMNYACKFYLIINVDQYNFLAVD